MKKQLHVAILFLLFGFGKLHAQQEALFTHYMFDQQRFNPAMAGGTGQYVTVNGDYLREWANFVAPEGEVAPQTMAGSIDVPIHPFQDKSKYFGIGFQAENDAYAFYITKSFLVSAAYHFRPKFGGDLSIGADVGIINKTVGPIWMAVDPGESFGPGKVSNNGLDAGIGAYYNYNNKWYVGISILHLPATKLEWGVATYTLQRTYYLTGGYNIDINKNPNLEIQPSLLVKTDGILTSTAVSTLFMYKQRFWGGLSLRDENATALAAMLGAVFVKGKWGDARVGVSYDVATQNPIQFGGMWEGFLSGRIKI